MAWVCRLRIRDSYHRFDCFSANILEVCSPFADRYGRKPSLLIVAIAGFIGGLMQTVSYGHFAVFYIGRWGYLFPLNHPAWLTLRRDLLRVLVLVPEQCLRLLTSPKILHELFVASL